MAKATKKRANMTHDTHSRVRYHKFAQDFLVKGDNGYSGVRALCDQFPKLKRFLVYQRFMRFMDLVKADECWIWHGDTDVDGYGCFYWPEKGISAAHVAAYRLFVGEVNKGQYVCHSCDTPACVNPRHLWLGTCKQNLDDMRQKGRYNGCGEQNGNSKLTWKDIRRIRWLHICGRNRNELCRKFKVTWGVIDSIVKEKTWKEQEL